MGEDDRAGFYSVAGPVVVTALVLIAALLAELGVIPDTPSTFTVVGVAFVLLAGSLHLAAVVLRAARLRLASHLTAALSSSFGVWGALCLVVPVGQGLRGEPAADHAAARTLEWIAGLWAGTFSLLLLAAFAWFGLRLLRR